MDLKHFVTINGDIISFIYNHHVTQQILYSRSKSLTKTHTFETTHVNNMVVVGINDLASILFKYFFSVTIWKPRTLDFALYKNKQK